MPRMMTRWDRRETTLQLICSDKQRQQQQMKNKRIRIRMAKRQMKASLKTISMLPGKFLTSHALCTRKERTKTTK